MYNKVTALKFSMLLSLLVGAVFLTLPAIAQIDATNQSEVGDDPFAISVYKTPTCGCCQKWIDYMADNGFVSEVIEQDDLNPLKTQLGIAGRYRSCHTGVVTSAQGEYVFEGHVPAEYVKQFLANPPAGALGLSVPGMPVGSPGMEVGERKDYYQVLLLMADGSDTVFAHVNAPQ